MLATTFGAGQVALSLLWFFLFIIELWLMFSIFIDIFRSHDLKGWAKALWVLFILLIPIVGILAYLIVRGDKMRAHQVQSVQMQQDAMRQYFQQMAPARSPVEDLHRLADLRDRGEINADEYRRLRAQILGEDQPPTSPPPA